MPGPTQSGSITGRALFVVSATTSAPRTASWASTTACACGWSAASRSASSGVEPTTRISPKARTRGNVRR